MSALGIGEARILSRHGQPLKIEVALNHDGSSDDYSASMASSATYGAMELDKNPDLHGALVKKIVRDGRQFVVVETREAYDDLWVSLVLEVQLQVGVLRRHFDFLMDMPEPPESLASATSGIEKSSGPPAPIVTPVAEKAVVPAVLFDESTMPPVLKKLVTLTTSPEPLPPNTGIAPRTVQPAADQPSLTKAKSGTFAANPGKPATRPVNDEGARRLGSFLTDIEQAELNLVRLQTTFKDVSSTLDQLERLRNQHQNELFALKRELREQQEVMNSLLANRGWASWWIVSAASLLGFLLGVLLTLFLQSGSRPQPIEWLAVKIRTWRLGESQYLPAAMTARATSTP